VLRITKVAEHPLRVTFKLEGRIVSEWVALLEHECLTALQEKLLVLLDFSKVTFISGQGVRMLNNIASQNLQIANCSALLEDLLKGGEEP
jgi:anti-anti-sigma regulatory factor